MDYYYSSSPGVSSRGRFSSRGASYRGSGRGETSYRGSRGYPSRGGYSSSRGRGSYYSKYETSTSKYPSGTHNEASKYGSHTRLDDSYRKGESSNYNVGRDHSHHRSDLEIGRKRMRNESYTPNQGTSSRRSHEVDDYRSGGGRYANANSYTESRGYSDNRGDFKKPRISEYKTKEDYRGRKEISRSSGQVSKSRSFRGRPIRGRGILRRGGENFLSRKRPSLSGGRRSASELLSLRKAKILKLKRQRFRERAKLELAKTSSSDRKSKELKEEEEGEKYEYAAREDKSVEEEKRKESPAEDKENCKEDGEIDEKAEEKEKDKEKDKDMKERDRERDRDRDRDRERERERDKEREKEKEKEKEKDKDKDKDKDKEKERDREREKDKDKDRDKEKSKRGDERIDFFGKPFMKLKCPQCFTKCVTFKEYMQHLYGPKHVRAMHEKYEKLKISLANMRVAQRAKQKKEDEEDVTNMSTKAIFCPICKLNYSQSKAAHKASEAHRKMRNFLLPYCKICRIPFRSAMMYERHICTLDHLRRKHDIDERLGKNKGSGGDYIDSFMVLDSVGSGDEVEDSRDEDDKSGKKDKEQKENEEEVHLGSEYIHKVEVLYCEVCRFYLPRTIEEKRAIKVHCWTKSHLRCYLRFGNNKLLEKIQGKDGKKAKENENENDNENESENENEDENQNGNENEKENNENKDGDNAVVVKPEILDESGKDLENHDDSTEYGNRLDDKLWADVKDLLNQVELEPKTDDEDEEGGRFDRFKSNEKKENGDVNPVDGDKEDAREPQMQEEDADVENISVT